MVNNYLYPHRVSFASCSEEGGAMGKNYHNHLRDVNHIFFITQAEQGYKLHTYLKPPSGGERWIWRRLEKNYLLHGEGL